jgi:uncharacterized protein YydD (DUF2326 family)
VDKKLKELGIEVRDPGLGTCKSLLKVLLGELEKKDKLLRNYMSDDTKERLDSISEVIVKSVGLQEKIKLASDEIGNLRINLESLEKEKNELSVKNNLLARIEEQNRLLIMEKSSLIGEMKKKEVLISELRKIVKYYSHNIISESSP